MLFTIIVKNFWNELTRELKGLFPKLYCLAQKYKYTYRCSPSSFSSNDITEQKASLEETINFLPSGDLKKKVNNRKTN